MTRSLGICTGVMRILLRPWPLPQVYGLWVKGRYMQGAELCCGVRRGRASQLAPHRIQVFRGLGWDQGFWSRLSGRPRKAAAAHDGTHVLQEQRLAAWQRVTVVPLQVWQNPGRSPAWSAPALLPRLQQPRAARPPKGGPESTPQATPPPHLQVGPQDTALVSCCSVMHGRHAFSFPLQTPPHIGSDSSAHMPLPAWLRMRQSA